MNSPAEFAALEKLGTNSTALALGTKTFALAFEALTMAVLSATLDRDEGVGILCCYLIIMIKN